MRIEESVWVSWAQAARIVGCPISTIDWNTRAGRITKRPWAGTRPTLDRESVESFARARAERQQAREHRRERSDTSTPPDPTGWTDAEQTAHIIGISAASVLRLARENSLPGVKIRRHWWFREQDVRDLAEERSRWVSYLDAATTAGCSTTTITAAIRDGRIERRTVAYRGMPSLSRASVAAFSLEWQTRQQARRERRQPATSGPPANGDNWLDTGAAAKLLGISRSRVSALARADRLPHTRRGRRSWFLLTHIESIASARRLHSPRSRELWAARVEAAGSADAGRSPGHIRGTHLPPAAMIGDKESGTTDEPRPTVG